MERMRTILFIGAVLSLPTGCISVETYSDEVRGHVGTAIDPLRPGGVELAQRPTRFSDPRSMANPRNVELLRPSRATDKVGVPSYTKQQVVRICDDGRMAIPGDALLDNALTRDFTLELWVRFDDGRNQGLVRASANLVLGVHDHRLIAELGGKLIEGPEIFEEEWTHVAIVARGSLYTLFVAGTPYVAAQPATGRPFGALIFGDSGFCGNVEQVKLSASAIYHKPFIADATFRADDGMLAGYNFDDTWGSYARDLSANHRHAVFLGAVTLIAGRL